MYRTRGFGLPGSVGGASAYLAQHDFVHVIADYGTNLNGELEVFALIGRADPDPKGFAWLATLIGLFGTGYVADAGFFSGDLQERRLDSSDMHVRIADALRRGQNLCDRLGVDLLELDYHELAARPVEDVRAELGIDPKGDAGGRRRIAGRLRPGGHVPHPADATRRRSSKEPPDDEVPAGNPGHAAVIPTRWCSSWRSGTRARRRAMSWGTSAPACSRTATSPAPT